MFIIREADFADRGGIIASVVIGHWGLLKWPTVRVVNKQSAAQMHFPWMWVRSQSSDGIWLRNERCVHCGWLTKRCFPETDLPEEHLCVECRNTGVCLECTYLAHDGHLYCAECSPRLGIPAAVKHISDFVDWYGLEEKLDALQLCGDYRSEKQIALEVFACWRMCLCKSKSSEQLPAGFDLRKGL